MHLWLHWLRLWLRLRLMNRGWWGTATAAKELGEHPTTLILLVVRHDRCCCRLLGQAGGWAECPPLL